MSPRVFVIVPAFNEGIRLERVLDDLATTGHAVVVVDDGSTDDTAGVARRYGCHLVRHALNRGQGAALQTGISFALSRGAEYLVTFDADGQHAAWDLPGLLAPLVEGRCDVTLGNRFLEARSEVPLARRLVLQGARLLTLLTSGVLVGDAHNGYRALSRRAAAALDLKQDGMAHASEIHDQIARAGLVVNEVPVTIRYSADTLAKGQRLSNAVSILWHYLLGRLDS